MSNLNNVKCNMLYKNPLLSSTLTVDDVIKDAVLLQPTLQVEEKKTDIPILQSSPIIPESSAPFSKVDKINQNVVMSGVLNFSNQDRNKTPDCRENTDDVKLSKEDDFDFASYYARLHSIPDISSHQQDQVNLVQENTDDFSEIDLRSPFGEEDDDCSLNNEGNHSYAADLASNLSQLPNVLPHVANTVFSSFSNIWNKNKGRSEVTSNAQLVSTDVSNNNPLHCGTSGNNEIQANDKVLEGTILHVPLLDTNSYNVTEPKSNVKTTQLSETNKGTVGFITSSPPAINFKDSSGSSNVYRISSSKSKKTYAKVPGLTLGETDYPCQKYCCMPTELHLPPVPTQNTNRDIIQHHSNVAPVMEPCTSENNISSFPNNSNCDANFIYRYDFSKSEQVFGHTESSNVTKDLKVCNMDCYDVINSKAENLGISQSNHYMNNPNTQNEQTSGKNLSSECLQLQHFRYPACLPPKTYLQDSKKISYNPRTFFTMLKKNSSLSGPALDLKPNVTESYPLQFLHHDPEKSPMILNPSSLEENKDKDINNDGEFISNTDATIDCSIMPGAVTEQSPMILNPSSLEENKDKDINNDGEFISNTDATIDCSIMPGAVTEQSPMILNPSSLEENKDKDINNDGEFISNTDATIDCSIMPGAVTDPTLMSGTIMDPSIIPKIKSLNLPNTVASNSTDATISQSSLEITHFQNHSITYTKPQEIQVRESLPDLSKKFIEKSITTNKSVTPPPVIPVLLNDFSGNIYCVSSKAGISQSLFDATDFQNQNITNVNLPKIKVPEDTSNSSEKNSEHLNISNISVMPPVVLMSNDSSGNKYRMSNKENISQTSLEVTEPQKPNITLMTPQEIQVAKSSSKFPEKPNIFEKTSVMPPPVIPTLSNDSSENSYRLSSKSRPKYYIGPMYNDSLPVETNSDTMNYFKPSCESDNSMFANYNNSNTAPQIFTPDNSVLNADNSSHIFNISYFPSQETNFLPSNAYAFGNNDVLYNNKNVESCESYDLNSPIVSNSGVIPPVCVTNTDTSLPLSPQTLSEDCRASANHNYVSNVDSVMRTQNSDKDIKEGAFNLGFGFNPLEKLHQKVDINKIQNAVASFFDPNYFEDQKKIEMAKRDADEYFIIHTDGNARNLGNSGNCNQNNISVTGESFTPNIPNQFQNPQLYPSMLPSVNSKQYEVDIVQNCNILDNAVTVDTECSVTNTFQNCQPDSNISTNCTFHNTKLVKVVDAKYRDGETTIFTKKIQDKKTEILEGVPKNNFTVDEKSVSVSSEANVCDIYTEVATSHTSNVCDIYTEVATSHTSINPIEDLSTGNTKPKEDQVCIPFGNSDASTFFDNSDHLQISTSRKMTHNEEHFFKFDMSSSESKESFIIPTANVENKELVEELPCVVRVSKDYSLFSNEILHDLKTCGENVDILKSENLKVVSDKILIDKHSVYFEDNPNFADKPANVDDGCADIHNKHVPYSQEIQDSLPLITSDFSSTGEYYEDQHNIWGLQNVSAKKIESYYTNDSVNSSEDEIDVDSEENILDNESPYHFKPIIEYEEKNKMESNNESDNSENGNDDAAIQYKILDNFSSVPEEEAPIVCFNTAVGEFNEEKYQEAVIGNEATSLNYCNNDTEKYDCIGDIDTNTIVNIMKGMNISMKPEARCEKNNVCKYEDGPISNEQNEGCISNINICQPLVSEKTVKADFNALGRMCFDSENSEGKHVIGITEVQTKEISTHSQKNPGQTIFTPGSYMFSNNKIECVEKETTDEGIIGLTKEFTNNGNYIPEIDYNVQSFVSSSFYKGVQVECSEVYQINDILENSNNVPTFKTTSVPAASDICTGSNSHLFEIDSNSPNVVRALNENIDINDDNGTLRTTIDKSHSLTNMEKLDGSSEGIFENIKKCSPLEVDDSISFCKIASEPQALAVKGQFKNNVLEIPRKETEMKDTEAKIVPSDHKVIDNKDVPFFSAFRMDTWNSNDLFPV